MATEHELDAAASTLKDLRREVTRHVLGQGDFVDGLVLTLLAGGHALVEGVPGLAKTRAVNVLARASGLDFHRIQFTPDLLPADIVGSEIYRPDSGTFETRTGPVFTHFVLADEINRAAPKVQSALLEAMQERQVTLGPETHALPRPFHVFATQNPVEQEGTYPLPEAQLDRFLMKLVVGYPSTEDEARVVRLVMDEVEQPPVERVVDTDRVLELQAAARAVHVEDELVRYATALVAALRLPAEGARARGLDVAEHIELGPSPRASIALVVVGRARALLDGRDAVYPEDVKAIAPAVLRHRVLLTYHAVAEGVTSDALVARALETVPIP